MPEDPRSDSASSIAAATEAVHEAAASAGFGLCGIAQASRPETLELFHNWLDAGFSGEMAYLERRRAAYGELDRVLTSVRSVVVVALDYRTDDPQPVPAGYGRISRYAWGDTDYHTVIREKLRTVADSLHGVVPECRTRAIVDTAPLLERDFARRAGLGWFGKNTMLISKQRGSFFFLGALLTDAELVPDTPHKTDHCGTCTACLDACPTDAFTEPYVLDARKCISYLTIELRNGDIPGEYQSKLDDWVFGCDVCQDVCPWNSKAPQSNEPAFQPVAHCMETQNTSPAVGPGIVSLDDVLAMDEAAFRARFSGTPIERTGLQSLQRNARYVKASQERSD